MQRLLSTLLALVISCALVGPVLAATGQPLLESGTQEDQRKQNDVFFNETGLTVVHPTVIISQIIKAVLAFLGVLFVVLMIYAGFLWLLSAGNEDQISKSKKIIVAAVIGLLIVLSAYLITIFIFDKLLVATGTNNGGSGSGSGNFEGS